MEIRTQRLLLRRFRSDDVDAVVAYRNDRDVARFQSWDPSYSRADAARLFAEDADVAAGQPGAWVQVAIEQQATGALCGDCGIHVLSNQPRTAEVGITLAPDYQGRGIATEALGAIIDWLFGDLDMHRVYAHTDDRNEAVQRLLERLGFRLEARLIEADWFKGEWTTLRVYALLRKEWRCLNNGR